MSRPSFGHPYAPSSASEEGNAFRFSMGSKSNVSAHNDRRRRFFKPHPPPNKTTSSSPAPPPSNFTFSFSPFNLGKEAEDEKSNKAEEVKCKGAEDEKGTPEITKTSCSTPSAGTGFIPCYFEGSSYSSEPLSRIPDTAEASVKSERDGTAEPSSSSLQLMVVSRVLKGVPQCPHFWPLKCYSEVARQRLMGAWDRIFEETMDQIRCLQVTGFWADARRLWETLEELQTLGYNVLTLRRRLVELADVVLSLERHRREIVGLKSKAEKHRMEKSRLEFEIVKLRAKVEAERAGYEEVKGRVAKMESELSSFNDAFTSLAIKLF